MKKITISLMLIATISLSYASTASDNLVTKIKNIKSISANFSQSLIDGRNNTTSQGIVIIKKPHFFKWTTKSPNKQEIVSNGKRLWIYDDDLEQLIIKKASDDISQFPYLILLSKNTTKINELFNVTEMNSHTYTLTPKNDEMISNIVISFGAKNALSSLVISTSIHQNTRIDFKNVKLNTNNINNNQFNFITPKNADVIDETRA